MLSSLPEALRQAPSLLQTAPERLRVRRARALREVRVRAARVRGEAAERLWHLETEALRQADGLMARGEELPLLGRVLPRERVQGRLAATLQPPIADYDTLNVKRVVAALEGLDRVDLLRVLARERAHKGRVTVTRAAEAALERLRAPEAAAVPGR